jgi:hypothetical protein
MSELLRASAAYEHRSESQICRMALAAFFENRGYFDPENIAALAAGKAVNNE